MMRFIWLVCLRQKAPVDCFGSKISLTENGLLNPSYAFSKCYMFHGPNGCTLHAVHFELCLLRCINILRSSRNVKKLAGVELYEEVNELF